MKRPKGPELKMPAVIADLYYDLRDRRLLPLIALVLVAIVATPFLLGQGSEGAEEAIPVPAAIQALKESGGQRTATLTVVEANPGLRDYRKRLRRRKPLDPFRTFGKPSLKGAQLGDGSEEGKGGGSSGSSAPTTSTSTTVKTKESSKTTSTTQTTTNTNGGSGKGSGGDGGGKEASTYTIDVQITIATDSGVSVKPVERLGVLPLTQLPGSEAPVVTYLGPASGGTKALFSVSKEVSGVFGEVKCVSGADTCETIELEPDFPVTFVYGPDQTRYRIKLVRIEPAQSFHP